MRECLNKRGKYYTGKENTPLGRGYSASGEKIGTRMRGKNGGMYVVVKYQGGKRWQRVGGRNVSPRGNAPKVTEYLNSILEKLIDSYSVTATEEGRMYTINYSYGKDGSIGVNVKTYIGHVKSTLLLNRIDIGDNFKSLGLCVPLVTYLLIKAYNDMIINYHGIIEGQVWIESEYPDRAHSCYDQSFRKIGFDLDRSYTNFVTESKMKEDLLVFKKPRPDDGWKELRNDYHYRRETDRDTVIIDYEISHKGIYAR